MPRMVEGHKYLMVAVKDSVHKRIKVRAAREGLTLTAFVQRVLAQALKEKASGV